MRCYMGYTEVHWELLLTAQAGARATQCKLCWWMPQSRENAEGGMYHLHGSSTPLLSCHPWGFAGEARGEGSGQGGKVGS